MSACVLGVAACIRDSLNTVLTLTAHTRWVDQPFLQTSMLESHSLPAALVTDICVSAGWRKLPFSRILQLCIPSSLLFAVSSSLWPCWDTVARCAATCCCCPGCVCLRLWTNSFLMVSFLKLETFYMSFTRRSVFPVLGLSMSPGPINKMFVRLNVAFCLFQYFGSLFVIFCVELASAVWTYDEVRKPKYI